MTKRGERPSKSAAKRDAQAARALADTLVALKPGSLEKLVDDVDIRAAVESARDMPSHGAGRRQRQYIAKLLRNVDTDIIRQRLAALEAGPKANKRLFHRAEALRDAVLSSPNPTEALTEAGLEPDGDLLQDIQFHANARDDRQRKRYARQTFRRLMALLEAEDTQA